MRRKQTVPAERTNSFFKSKLALARRKKPYFRFAKIRVKVNSDPASSKETVKRSSVIVIEGSDPIGIISSMIALLPQVGRCKYYESGRTAEQNFLGTSDFLDFAYDDVV